MELVALDLEGSGAQDRDQEAILEIAVVPIRNWQPDLANAYHTLIDPGRVIPRRPWISPGLTNTALRQAPPLTAVEPELARRINGRHLVGHNIGVDWRLLHRRCPTITPDGLVDTLRLARRVRPPAKGMSLSALVEDFDLTEMVNQAAAGSVPHRALWDTVAAALLLRALASEAFGGSPPLDALLAHSEDPTGESVPGTAGASQPSLFD
jgi:DNA polymerase III epsilon subunit-like protein